MLDVVAIFAHGFVCTYSGWPSPRRRGVMEGIFDTTFVHYNPLSSVQLSRMLDVAGTFRYAERHGLEEYCADLAVCSFNLRENYNSNKYRANHNLSSFNHNLSQGYSAVHRGLSIFAEHHYALSGPPRGLLGLREVIQGGGNCGHNHRVHYDRHVNHDPHDSEPSQGAPQPQQLRASQQLRNGTRDSYHRDGYALSGPPRGLLGLREVIQGGGNCDYNHRDHCDTTSADTSAGHCL